MVRDGWRFVLMKGWELSKARDFVFFRKGAGFAKLDSDRVHEDINFV